MYAQTLLIQHDQYKRMTCREIHICTETTHTHRLHTHTDNFPVNMTCTKHDHCEEKHTHTHSEYTHAHAPQ